METSNSSVVANLFAADSLLKVSCSDLVLGMYVSELDCAWSKTPFPVGGFHLRKVGDIEQLHKYCKSVSIDTNKGVQPRAEKLNQLTILSSAREAVPSAATLKIDRDAYPCTHSIKQQLDRVFGFYANLREEFLAQSKGLRAGEEMDLSRLEPSINGLTWGIVANPQTLIWILNTDPSERNETGYCVRAAIWATILARQIGMSRNELRTLFLGTLLADIGIQLLPEKLAKKHGPFRKKEALFYRKHVELGVELAARYPELDDRVLGIIRCHHERRDGLGFPRGLRGEQIPLLARFANLAYCYERLLRSNTKGVSNTPAGVLTKLYKQRVLKFPEQLIVEFIHVMGTYPIGSLVELSSGEIALVLEQNNEEKLSPRVALLTDRKKIPLARLQKIELGRQAKSKEGRRIRGSFSAAAASVTGGNLIAESEALRPGNYTFKFRGIRVGKGSLGFRL